MAKRDERFMFNPEDLKPVSLTEIRRRQAEKQKELEQRRLDRDKKNRGYLKNDEGEDT